MASLAAAEDTLLAVSDLELSRPGPTYTWDTLHALADAGYAASQIFFIIGADAFAGIDTWHRFPEVLDAGHFAVVTRPGHAWPESLLTHPAIAPRLRVVDGTSVSQRASDDDCCAIWLIEAETPDVSSTDIRQNILTGEGTGRDVPDLVAAHIRRHGLYSGSLAARRLHGED
jgi:nicotinate-nucleotide adenylyltransferase